MTSGFNWLHEIFDTNASRMGSKVAVREVGKDWTYTELLARSQILSEHLASLGVGRGHRVGIMLPNSGAFVMSFFSVLRTGAVVVPLSDRYRKQELFYYLSDASPSVILASTDSVGRINDTLAALKHTPVFIEIGLDGGYKTIEKGQLKEAGKTETAAVASDLPLMLQYTSGSTGDPKRVLRTHGQLIFELGRLSEVFELEEDGRYLGVAPFSHVNGLVRTMLSSMINCGTLYPMPFFNRREVMSLITRERITYFGGVPYMYITLAATPVRTPVDFSSMRTAFSSSAPLLPEDNRAFARNFGFNVRQLYGSTETGTISVNTEPDISASLESVGWPLEGVRVEIFGDEGQILDHGREGEVGISSPAAITAYEDNHAANAESFMGSFYLSGDLGFKDGKGRLTLTGRKKYLINRGGYEVNPFETERAIMSHPCVEEVVVFGVPTRHGDFSIKSLIVSKAPCTEKEIIEHCRSVIADYKIPGTIEFVKSLPKSPTGKILREKCS